MSRNENHWYMVRAYLDARSSIVRRGAVVWAVVTVVLVAVLLIGRALGDAGSAPAAADTGLRTGTVAQAWPAWLVGLLAVTLIVGLGLATAAFFVGRALGRLKLTNMGRSYRAALRAPEPAPLLAAIDRATASSQWLPNADASRIWAVAVGWALYGRESEARRALGTVDWNGRPPMIRATGVQAGGVVELLCRRNARRALELFRTAQRLSARSRLLPGSARIAAFHGTYVAIGEALTGEVSPDGLRLLEKTASGVAGLPDTLLATFGLAAALEASGEDARAAALREALRETAPACAVLQLGRETFDRQGGAEADSVAMPAAGDAASTLVAGDAASTLVAGDAASTLVAGDAAPSVVAGEQRALGRRRLGRALKVGALQWALLIALWAAWYVFFRQPQ